MVFKMETNYLFLIIILINAVISALLCVARNSDYELNNKAQIREIPLFVYLLVRSHCVTGRSYDWPSGQRFLSDL
jgi:hypothetical protein